MRQRATVALLTVIAVLLALNLVVKGSGEAEAQVRGGSSVSATTLLLQEDETERNYRSARELSAAIVELDARVSALEKFHERAKSDRPRATIPRGEADLLLHSWTWRREDGYIIAEGLVQNLTSRTMKNAVALLTTYDADGTFVTSDNALLEYQDLLPGQNSPFTVMLSANPAIAKCAIEFKYFGGGRIPTTEDGK